LLTTSQKKEDPYFSQQYEIPQTKQEEQVDHLNGNHNNDTQEEVEIPEELYGE
jgi:hypothetical protein